MSTARELADYASGAAFIADTGYDSNDFIDELRARGIKPVIHSKPERKRPLPPIGRSITRYLMEVCFHELKRLRGTATRYDKTKRSFLALLHIGCICLWLN